GAALRGLLLPQVLLIFLPEILGLAGPPTQLLQPGPRLDLRHPDVLVRRTLPPAAGMNALGDDALRDGVLPLPDVLDEGPREGSFVNDPGEGEVSEVGDEVPGRDETPARQVEVEKDDLLGLVLLVQAREGAGPEELTEGHQLRDAPVLLEVAQ